jgi:hypothetical protein
MSGPEYPDVSGAGFDLYEFDFGQQGYQIFVLFWVFHDILVFYGYTGNYDL